MNKSYVLRFGLPILFALSLPACRDRLPEERFDRTTVFSVAEARKVYESNLRGTRAEASDPELPSLGAITPQWSQAKPSENEYAASVDVPILSETLYLVEDVLSDGTSMSRLLYPKMVVLQGRETGGNDCYVAFYIPDCDPQRPSSEDIGAHYLNSLPKTGFSGRILFTTLDGLPVAAARYFDGEQVSSAFFWDFDTTEAYLDAFFATIDEIVLRRIPSDSTRGIHDNNIIPGVVVIATNMGWRNVLDSIHEHTESLDHINPSTGGGSGGGGTAHGNGNSDAGNDQKPNPHLRTDDEEVEELLDELFLDCMGNALLNALDYNISIESGTGNNRFYYEETYSGNHLISQSGKIEISKMEDYVLLEELMHAYQYRNGKSHGRDNALNNEIEAKVAWLLYMERKYGKQYSIIDKRDETGGINGINAFRDLIYCFKEGIGNNSLFFQSAYEEAIDALSSYESYKGIHESRNDRDFTNLSELMSNC